jgi:O-antigen chain-terminating methyltransferase
VRSPEARDEPRQISDFLDDPTRDLQDWRWLWRHDAAFPVQSHRGALGKLIVGFKKLLRPLVKSGGADLWDRQQVFNLIVLEYLARIQPLEQRTAHFEAFLKEGVDELMRYNDALYSRVDQKLDRYRREAADLVSMLGAAAAAPTDRPTASTALSRAVEDRDYQELERRFRGADDEIRDRIGAHVPLFAGRRDVVDLGCGRGEALSVLGEAGIGCRGVDASPEMVRLCRERGLDATQGDLGEFLAGLEPGSIDGIVSFHVIEHLPVADVIALVKLAWRALEPGGRLLLETPNPRSLTVAANLFWRDPTHLRPIHPDVLRLALEMAGFDEVEIVDLHPFPEDERLPEIDLDELDPGQRALAHRINLLRDRLDDSLYGSRDYAAVGTKAAAQKDVLEQI